MIPTSWLPAAAMRAIVVHWTAGTNNVTSLDKKHYHFIIDGNGNVVRGDHPVSANVKPVSGKYAAHTLNFNTGTIGISLAGMAGAIESPFNAGKYPITKQQWETLIKCLKQLSDRYGIPVKESTILTHAEVQPNLGIAQRGKWDITRLPFDPAVVGHKAVGDKMRREIQGSIFVPIPTPEVVNPATKRMRVTANALNMRRGPGVQFDIRGSIPKGVVVEVLSENPNKWYEVKTPFGVVGWVNSSYLAV